MSAAGPFEAFAVRSSPTGAPVIIDSAMLGDAGAAGLAVSNPGSGQAASVTQAMVFGGAPGAQGSGNGVPPTAVAATATTGARASRARHPTKTTNRQGRPQPSNIPTGAAFKLVAVGGGAATLFSPFQPTPQQQEQQQQPLAAAHTVLPAVAPADIPIPTPPTAPYHAVSSSFFAATSAELDAMTLPEVRAKLVWMRDQNSLLDLQRLNAMSQAHEFFKAGQGTSDTMHKLKEEVAAKKHEADVSHRNLKEAIHQLASLREELAAAQQARVDANVHLATFGRECTAQQRLLEGAEATMQAQKDAAAAESERLNALIEKMQAERSELAKTVAVLEATQDSREEAVSSLETQLVAALEEQKLLRSELAAALSAAAKVAPLQEKVYAMEQGLAAEKVRNVVLEAQAVDLQQLIAECDAAVKGLQQAAADLQVGCDNQIVKLKEQAAAEAQCMGAAAEKAAAEAAENAAAAAAAVQSAKAAQKSVEEALAASQNELAALRKELEEVRGRGRVNVAVQAPDGEEATRQLLLQRKAELKAAEAKVCADALVKWQAKRDAERLKAAAEKAAAVTAAEREALQKQRKEEDAIVAVVAAVVDATEDASAIEIKAAEQHQLSPVVAERSTVSRTPAPAAGGGGVSRHPHSRKSSGSASASSDAASSAFSLQPSNGGGGGLAILLQGEANPASGEGGVVILNEGECHLVLPVQEQPVQGAPITAGESEMAAAAGAPVFAAFSAPSHLEQLAMMQSLEGWGITFLTTRPAAAQKAHRRWGDRFASGLKAIFG